ncbi:hypothetical protein [Arsenophonus sp. PmNCSU2021_1]
MSYEVDPYLEMTEIADRNSAGRWGLHCYLKTLKGFFYASSV